MERISKEALAAAESAVEGAEEESGHIRINDITPSGALLIGGFPARGHCAADQMITESLFAWLGRSDIRLTGSVTAAIIIYCAIQVSDKQISNLCRALNAGNDSFYYDVILPWAASIDSEKFEQMAVDATTRFEEFMEIMEVIKSSAGGDESGEVVAATG